MKLLKKYCIFPLFVFLSSILTSCGKSVPWIMTDGKQLVDSSGNDFVIKSISLGNWLNLEGYMWYFDGPDADRQSRIETKFKKLLGDEVAEDFFNEYREKYITEEDLRQIANMGFNTVKIPIHWNILLEKDSPLQFKNSGFELLDRVIRQCSRHGLYVILDLHSAPGGQTGSNIDDSPNNKPELFMKKKYQDRTVALWSEIARRYSNKSVILAYDLLNEPLTGQQGRKYYNDLEPLLIRITEGIRKYDTRHIITITGPVDAADWLMFGSPFDDKLLYQFHFFGAYPAVSTIQSFLDFRDKFNVPIWCGGMGENNNRHYKLTFILLKENQIGWSFWSWKKMGSPNNPVSLPMIRNWTKIINYMKGITLSREEGLIILESLLENCQFKRCTINEEVLSVIFPENEQAQ